MHSISKKIAVIAGFLSLGFLLGEFFLLARIAEFIIPANVLVRFIVSLITVGCGITCAFFYSTNKNTRPVVFFLYAYSLSVLNAYVKIDNGIFSNSITFILFDLFSLQSVTCLLLLTSRSYASSEHYKKHEIKYTIVAYFPAVLFCIKHILVVSAPEWNSAENPLKYLTHIIFVLVCINFLVMFLHMYSHTSRESTMMLRFITIGTCFTMLPAASITFVSFLTSEFHFTMTELCLMNLPLVFLPLIATTSIFLYRSERTNFIVRMFIVFTGYVTMMIVSTYEHYIHLTSKQFFPYLLLTLAFSPYCYFLFKHPINAFLILETPQLKKTLKNYEDVLLEKDNLVNTFDFAISQLKQYIKYSYCFICISNKNEWSKIYSWPEYLKDDIIDNVIKENLRNEGKRRKNEELSNNGMVYNYYSDNVATIKIFLGPKTNGDKYLPSEISVGQRFLMPLFKSIMIDQNKNINEEFLKASKKSNLLDKEIQLAAFVQQSYYPKAIGTLDGWEIQFYCKPMAGVSGDLYDFYNRKSILDGLGIYDVSGHGISSGLVTMLARNIIRQEFYRYQNKSLDQVMAIIDKRFRAEKNQIENFITGILIRIKENSVEMVNAAHPYPIVYKKDENKLFSYKEINKSIGSVIGLSDFPSNFNKSEFTLNSGDELIMFTDGVTEAMNCQHSQYGEDRLFEVVEKSISLSTKEQLDAIINDVNLFMDNAPANDDITLIILKKL